MVTKRCQAGVTVCNSVGGRPVLRFPFLETYDGTRPTTAFRIKFVVAMTDPVADPRMMARLEPRGVGVASAGIITPSWPVASTTCLCTGESSIGRHAALSRSPTPGAMARCRAGSGRIAGGRAACRSESPPRTLARNDVDSAAGASPSGAFESSREPLPGPLPSRPLYEPDRLIYIAMGCRSADRPG